MGVREQMNESIKIFEADNGFDMKSIKEIISDLYECKRSLGLMRDAIESDTTLSNDKYIPSFNDTNEQLTKALNILEPISDPLEEVGY